MRKLERRNRWIFATITTLILTASLVAAHEIGVPAPAPYADMENPIPAIESIAAGKEIYTKQCAFCHGGMGDGKGPVGTTLEPKPADFTDAERMDHLTDAYLFWRISEGGGFEPFNSAMPANKDVLSEDEMWDVVNYLRTFSFDKPEAPPTPPPSEEGEEEDISKLGVDLRAYSVGAVGIIATIILIIFAYIVIRKEGY